MKTTALIPFSLFLIPCFAAVPTAREMRGPFPIMSTPYFEKGEVDYEGLKRELKFVDESGCPGVIWCQSNDAVDLLTTEEKFKGFEACAQAAEGRGIVLTLGVDDTNTAHMLELAAEVERVAFAPVLAKIWKLRESGETGLRLTEAYAMFRVLCDQRNFPPGLRGYPLYFLEKEGVFRNRVSRKYVNTRVTEGGSFGVGNEWKLDTVELTELQKKELDLLYAEMLEWCERR